VMAAKVALAPRSPPSDTLTAMQWTA
jgi:hypothetical protein